MQKSCIIVWFRSIDLRGKSMDICKAILNERFQLERKKLALSEKLEGAPDGNIFFDKNGNTEKWRCVYDNHKKPSKYISKKNTQIAEQLALKRHLLDIINDIDARIAAIDQFLENFPALHSYPNYLSDNSKDYRKLLKPSFSERSAILKAWSSEKYDKCQDHPEKLIVPTKAGIMVRSKSEAIIANELFDNGIPFRYEQALPVSGMKVYSDFAILHPLNLKDIIIWEHFGLMDVDSYAANAKLKTAAYIEAGYLPSRNLILTYESKSNPLDINYVSLLVGYYFL